MAKGDGKRRGGSKRREHWKEEPDGHDYPAATDYLTLVLAGSQVAPVVGALRDAPIVHRKAKDLLRASRLALLGADNPHVAIDLNKVRHGDRLSPVLLVRGSLTGDVAMTIADGYHRVCASYHLDENADIPCRLVDPPAQGAAREPTRVAARAARPRVGAAGRSPKVAAATVPATP